MSLLAPALKHLCDLTVTVTTPIDAGYLQGLSTQCKRRIIPISGVINGLVLPGGADFQLVRGDTVPPERMYFRCAPAFEVEYPSLHWMT